MVSTENKPQVAMVGLAVMGSNLALNIESHGYSCVVYNRSPQVTAEFMRAHHSRNFVAVESLAELVKATEAPRKVFLMVKAGNAVDAVIADLLEILQPGDLIIDGGNSHYSDTARREVLCREKGILFLGLGVSGGEEGALKGPSLMPGGSRQAWELVSDLLSSIAANVQGKACATYMGPGGAGHFVKMVHNGIEYGDMQLIAEAYDLLKNVAGCQPNELSQIFGEWNRGVLSSFLIEISAQIFDFKDSEK
ncbi:MAG: NADP-dependent phosphogluconate dehydrogenase, partial [Bdellovibrionales bacterium]|nr:NADP-dependent phosphogluconate dehydrogenase [Bdellovibrionales bacterium]